MLNVERYPFVSSDTALGEAGFRPYLPFILLHKQVSVQASALLDISDNYHSLSMTSFKASSKANAD